MNDLFDRIWAAKPSLLLLSDDELALLEAYVDTYQQPSLSLSRLQEEDCRGMTKYRDDLNAEKSRLAFLRCVCEYNQIRRADCERFAAGNQAGDCTKSSSPTHPDAQATVDKSTPAQARERETSKPAHTLPKLQKHDRRAYQLSLFDGKTQRDIAELLAKEYGEPFSQGQVSKMIKRAKRHAEASGLAELTPPAAGPVKSVDPERLDLGPRSDGRVPRQRSKCNSDAE